MATAEPKSLDPSRIWWVIPVCNDAATLREVARKCREQLPGVVVVDDGSTDADVFDLLADLDVTVLTQGRNLGKGVAIRTGIEFVERHGGAYAITIDADGQLFPEDLSAFLPELSEDQPSLVIGARRFEGTSAPGSSRFGRDFGNFWLWVETGVWIADCQSGFRAYPVQEMSRLRCFGRRFEFEAEILARAVWAGLPLRTVPIGVHYPEPHLRVSRFRPLVDNARLTLMHTHLIGRRFSPLPYQRI